MMVITDLDGTLLPKGGRFSEMDLATLVRLGRQRVLRVIATGRSLYSLNKVVPPDFPIDYLIFSSGAGIVDWPGQRLLKKHSLNAGEVEAVFITLRSRGLDFMIHNPIPDNHFFLFFKTGRHNPDFTRRCGVYWDFASAGDPSHFIGREACQYLAIEPDTASPSQYEAIKQELADLMVLRATSPLDGRSTWIEIFNSRASKSRAAAWLAGAEGIQQQQVLALGNDYNDLDLLHWAGSSFVVQDCPAELSRQFPRLGVKGSCLSEAVSRWQAGL